MKIYKDGTEREIKYAFHDVDGTHSLIRDWSPVMSIVLYDVIENGLAEDFDSEENLQRLVSITGKKPLPETDRFCIESAGLSGLTQMEWSIRRAIEEGKIDIPCDKQLNSYKIQEIWKGKEVFEEEDSKELSAYLTEYTPKLFKLYENVLNAFCRDKNLEEAKKDPDKFRIKGSMRFLNFLKDNGVINYFVTGAVVEEGKGMHEEVAGLGYQVGHGQQMEALIGSTWDEKLPKDVIMHKLLKTLHCKGEEVLIVGDGRSEISAGVAMGAFTIGRLSKNAHRQREILETLGVDMIVEDFENEEFYQIFKK